MITLSYEDFKAIANSKSLLWQYTEFSDHYELVAADGVMQYSSTIYKSNTAVEGIDSETEATRISDFESNHKSTANQPLEYRSTDGLLKFASAKFSDVKSFWVDGTATQANLASGETKYIKKHFTETYTISGVDARWQGSNWGDYIDFEVGFYTDESDETTFNVANKFADHYMILGDGSRIFDVPTVREIPSTVTISGYTFNLYIRAKCVNVGSSPSKVIVNLIGWK